MNDLMRPALYNAIASELFLLRKTNKKTKENI